MSRFIEIRGVNINADALQDFCFTKDKHLRITYRTGETDTFDCSTYSERYLTEQLSGDYHLVQVLPCVEPCYAVWFDELANEHFVQAVQYLGLTAAGTLEGVELNDEGYFEKIEGGNYLGIYRKASLTLFSNVTFLHPEEKTRKEQTV